MPEPSKGQYEGELGELFSAQKVASELGLDKAQLEGLIRSGEFREVHSETRAGQTIQPIDVVRFVRKQGQPLPGFLQHFSKRVLVAEDEAAMANAIVRVLRSAKYTTMIAPDGFQAGSVLESFCPAVLILDLNMPHMKGLDVLKYIRQNDRYSHIKVVVVSAAPKDQLAEAQNEGADCVLAKPFDNERLLAEVEALV